MNHTINSLLAALNSIGEAFCEHAAGVFVQSALLVVVLFVVDLLLRKRVRAVFRYCVWLLVLVKLVLPPTLSLPTGVGYWAGDHLPSALNVSSRPFDAPGLERSGASGERFHGRPSDDLAKGNPLVAATNTPVTALTWQAILFALWLVGVLTFLALLFQRARFVRALIAASNPAKEKFAELLEECRRQIGVRSKTTLRISDTIPSPAVCGFFRPTIVIPAALVDKLSPEGLRAILIHELAHIKRGDLWVNSIQTFLQIVYFYNPFVWFANSVIRKVCEEAVDESVLVTLGGRAQDYSNTLIDIGEMVFWKADLGLRLIGVAESRKALQWRIRHMLNRPIPKSSKLSVLGTAALIVVAATLLPMARAEKSSRANQSVASENEARTGNPLHKAVARGNIEQVKSLISKGVDVNARNENGVTPLYYAAKYGRQEVAELLIIKGAHVNVKEDGWGTTPLNWTTRGDHRNLAELLIANGANVNSKGHYGWTPLHDTARHGARHTAELLLAKGADISAKGQLAGMPAGTPLHIAADEGHKEVAELLIAKGADVNTKDIRWYTPLQRAANKGHRDLVELLIAKGADVSSFHLAACIGDLARVMRFCDETTDIDTKDELYWTPLSWAAFTGKRDVVELLLAKGANVNVKNGWSGTPLHHASRWSGSTELVELLLAKGADINARDWIERTPLYYAARDSHKELVEVLLANGADVNARCKYRTTPVEKALGENHREVFELLVAKGADISPLLLAACRGDGARVKRLIENGADVDVRTQGGVTPLCCMVLRGSEDIVQLLVDNGADVNANTKGNWNWTPLLGAAELGHKDLAELLIAKGADVNAKDGDGRTPLGYAQDEGYTDIVELLLKHGAKE